MKIPISSIIVNERQRPATLDHLDSMGDPAIGQLHPIGVTNKMVLLWGNCRLEKAKSLGWTEIEATIRTGVSPTDAIMIEYIENVERKGMTWQEECLALYKLDHAKKLEEGFGYGGWTLRRMQDFTGFSKNKLGYMLQVAEELRATKDAHAAGTEGTIWDCNGVTEAGQFILAQTERLLHAELQRRRHLNNPVAPTELEKIMEEDAKTVDLQSGDVPLRDTTAPEVKVYIHGRPYRFGDAKGQYSNLDHLILGYNICPDNIDAIVAALRPTGYVILWFDDPDSAEATTNRLGERKLFVMPHRLIWNKVSPNPNIGWPFARNYALGIVAAKTEQLLHGDPVSSVVSAIQDDAALLPTSVVDACLTPIVLNNMAVTLIGGIDPLDIVALSRIPIWYEPDEALYKANLDRLSTHYMETIPGVKLVLPS